MPRLGMDLGVQSLPSVPATPPLSQYVGTNALTDPRLSLKSGVAPLVENYNTAGPAGYYNQDLSVLAWRHYSPTYTNTIDYKTLGLKYFLSAYPPYELGIALRSPHLVKLAGIGSTLIAFNSLTRTYPDPPMRQITNDPTGPGTSTTNWVKYEIFQEVNIPVGATVVNVGAMILAPADDPLREFNFGGFYVFAGGNGSPAKVSIDYAAVCGASVPTLLGSTTSSYTRYQETDPSNSLFMWAGPQLTGIGAVGNDRWNQDLYIKKVSVAPGATYSNQVLASDFTNWKQLDVRIPLPLGGSGNGVNNSKLGFSLYFAESHSYLNNSGIPSGSVWFYDPYVVFS